MKGKGISARGLLVVCLGAAMLIACSSAPVREPAPTRKAGGYYLDDGPGTNPPANLDRIPDAEPKAEPIKASTTRPYTVFGRTYSPMARVVPYKARGRASWYGKRYHGQATASGEPYDMYAMTAAHRTLPIPSYARVTNLRTGKAVTVRINDRGPFRADRLIDLSYTAAHRLGIAGSGSDLVEVESIILGESLPGPVLEAPTPSEADVAPIQTAPVKVGQATATTPPQPQSPAQPPESRVERNPESSIVQRLEVSLPQEPKGVYVQLGAFSLRPKAESFLSQMRSEIAWLGDAIRLYARDGLYRVHAGPYVDARQADQVATRIEQTIDIRPIVIVR